MSGKPLTIKSKTKEGSRTKKSEEHPYDLVVKCHEMFKLDKIFQCSDMYNQINNFNYYIQI